MRQKFGIRNNYEDRHLPANNAARPAPYTRLRTAMADPLEPDFKRCSALMREAYPKRADGRTIFPFRRVFIVAKK